jgi:2-dehydro-3-deoxyphosphogluconate aldolase/(4S)-4-hydroxy-2-oxoglutarate aldolase
VERNTDPSDGTTPGERRLRAAWSRLPVLPVLRLPGAREAVEAALTLADAGLETVELTATTEDWEQALRAVLAARPDLAVGLGTVRDAATARTALAAGAAFLVTPYPVPEVRHEVGDRVPVVQGGWTPAEVAAATSTGIGKLFPAGVGGPQHLAGLLAVLPEAALVPTGGIGLDDVETWLDAGALAVGVGSALVKDLQRDPDAVAARLDELRRPG